ncbi:hypothetical protein QTG54_002281 [Skeletonema marinoi]|uniref:Uncharacterized protein n=1 Tax=Skeletonema marinoi TaxID=267567 RepID=A0AAD9DH35_9STRA|nr:hypothetical protein QTG54_002281 [Skeletonema marinoi]
MLSKQHFYVVHLQIVLVLVMSDLSK